MNGLSRKGSALAVAGGDMAARSAELLLGGELAVRARADESVRVGSALWFALHSRAPSTIRSYEGSWRRVKRMCEQRGVCPLPMASEDVADLIAAMADEGRAVSTIRGVCNVIRLIHRAQNLDDPTATATVESVKHGIYSQFGFRRVKHGGGVGVQC